MTSAQQLNHINVSLFTPALLFSKVAFFLSPAKLKELWIIPIVFVLTTLVSASVAWLLGSLFRLKKSQRSFGMAAAMFMNSNSLPIALMQSLVVTVPGLKWGQDDNKNAMLGRALTYLVLYSTLGMILRWSYGVRLLAQADDDDPAGEIRLPEDDGPLILPDAPSPTSNPADSPTFDSRPLAPSDAAYHFSPSIVVHRHDSPGARNGNGHTPTRTAVPGRLRPHAPRHDSTFYRSFPNSPNQSRAQLAADTPTAVASPLYQTPSDSDASESDDEGGALPTAIPRRRSREAPQPPPSPWKARMRRLKRRAGNAWRSFNEFMTVPLWAAAASLLVACAPPLQHALDAHIAPLKNALAAAGNCSIPLTLVVLGAYFYTPPEERAREEDARRQSGVSLATARSFSSVSLMSSIREMFKLHAYAQEPSASASAALEGHRGIPERSRSLMSARGERARPGETRTVVIAVLSRMLLTPALLLPMMAASAKWEWHGIFAECVLRFFYSVKFRS